MRIFGKTGTTAKSLAYLLGLLVCVVASVRQTSAQEGADGTRSKEAAQAVRDSATEVRTSSFEAKLRIRGKILGQDISGNGTYTQLRGRPETLFRLELSLQAGKQIHSVVHVCDGRFLWMKRQSPAGAQLSRVDVRRIREATLNSGGELPSRTMGTVFSMGGVPRLIDAIQERFVFVELKDSQLGQLDVWQITGHWDRRSRDEKRSSDSPGPVPADQIPADNRISVDNIPPKVTVPESNLNATGPQVPDQVVVSLGHQPHFPLFPYRIEFLRTVPLAPVTNQANSKGQGRGVTTLLQLDFFEVGRRPDLVASQFTFHPGDLELVDRTDEYLAELRVVADR